MSNYSPITGEAASSDQLIIVTDLDGTLLDAKTYSPDIAKPCVARALSMDVAVVACSSKTMAEQIPLRKELRLESEPFIVENGSALIAPEGYFTSAHIGHAMVNCGFKVQIKKLKRDDLPFTYEALVLGTEAAEIRKALEDVKKIVPCLSEIKTFADLHLNELAELTGLSKEAAGRARSRDYSATISTPLDENMKVELSKELKKKGLTYACGGRFHTVTANGMDKGTAVQLLKSLLQAKLENVHIVGLGDAENDRTMLEAVDEPYLVKRPDGSHSEAADPMKRCIRVNSVGPYGWLDAVGGALDKLEGSHPSLSVIEKRAASKKKIPSCWPCDQGVFDAKDFLADLDKLRARKKEMGVTVSFIFPTLEEEETIGYILDCVNSVKEGLLDEVVVIDGNSQDKTREIAASKGAKVILAPEVLTEWKKRGKGIQLWKSLAETKGDICCWCDSDITNFTEVFVIGLIGPLLADPDCRYVKAFYKRPLRTGDGAATGAIGGRVTELCARPFINLFYPELHDIIQPLSGEFGGWRRDLEKLSFMVGYGVETKLLLEFSRIYGADSIRQVNLHERCHRHQSLPALSKMSFLILQTFMTDMSERFLSPELRLAMQTHTRIIRAGAASNDNVNKVRTDDKERAAEQHAGGIIATSLQEIEAKEIPLPPIITQVDYLKNFYPNQKKNCCILVSLHGCDTASGKAIQSAVKDLGTTFKRKSLPVKRVVADMCGHAGLPLRAAADLLNCLDEAELDVAQLKPQQDDSEAPVTPEELQKKILANLLEQLGKIASLQVAGDFDSSEKTSIILADSDTIKILYQLVYNVEYAKAFEEAEKADFLCTAWRFDYLVNPAAKAETAAAEPAKSAGYPTHNKTGLVNNGCVVGAQMRRLQF
eukprot:TRINITY_DN3170_c1_g2_i1.p1 TRINITY_DN3170_c1_g2~~TRINITY_DN3170_c1_g2_i1.p1  ORF type:complete len:906 (+),score=297.41 TRINITY_DN3170_c1_g2_i1:74-2719(+)